MPRAGRGGTERLRARPHLLVPGPQLRPRAGGAPRRPAPSRGFSSRSSSRTRAPRTRSSPSSACRSGMPGWRPPRPRASSNQHRQTYQRMDWGTVRAYPEILELARAASAIRSRRSRGGRWRRAIRRTVCWSSSSRRAAAWRARCAATYPPRSGRPGGIDAGGRGPGAPQGLEPVEAVSETVHE